MVATELFALGGCVDPTLVVIGLSHPKAPIEVRERFWMGESRRYECLSELRHSEGIEETVVLATCSRTEFILWASDFSAAAAAVPKFLTRYYGLRFCEWKDFHRLLGDDALRHVFRLAAGLDSMPLGDPQAPDQVRSAWVTAQQAGATGRFLDNILEEALRVGNRIRSETEIGAAAVSVPYAAVELARQRVGSLEGRKALILGAGKMAELSARYLVSDGARVVLVTSRTYRHAVNLAETLHSQAVPFDERWQHLEDADLVISCIACPHTILTREDAARIASTKLEGQQLLLIDLAMPRSIDPTAQELPGISLHNLDDLMQLAAPTDLDRDALVLAEKTIAGEVESLQRKLASERRVSAQAALATQLEEMRRQEVERYERDCGPSTAAQNKSLDELTHRLVERTAELVDRANDCRQAEKQPQSPVSTVRPPFHPHPASPAPSESQHRKL